MFNRSERPFTFRVQNQISRFLNFSLSDTKKAEILQNIVAEESNYFYDFIYQNSIGPFMYFQIKEMGFLDDIPEEFETFLRYIYEKKFARNFALKMELERCLQVLSKEGISAMLLKGAITFVKPIYPSPFLRFMSDIDLLVKQQELAKAIAILEDLGYLCDISVFDGKRLRHYHQHLYTDIGIGAVELHHYPISLRYSDWIDLDSWWAEAEEVTLGKASALIPSPKHQILHILLHNGIGHESQLLSNIGRQFDFALNVEYYRDKINWEAYAFSLRNKKFRKLLEIYLYLTHKNIGLKLPYNLHHNPVQLQRYISYIEKISQVPECAYLSSCLFHAMLRSNNSFVFF